MTTTLVLPPGVDPITALFKICDRRRSVATVLKLLMEYGPQDVVMPFTEMATITQLSVRALKNAVRHLRYTLGFLNAAKRGRVSVYEVYLERVQAALSSTIPRPLFVSYPPTEATSRENNGAPEGEIQSAPLPAPAVDNCPGCGALLHLCRSPQDQQVRLHLMSPPGPDPVHKQVHFSQQPVYSKNSREVVRNSNLSSKAPAAPIPDPKTFDELFPDGPKNQNGETLKVKEAPYTNAEIRWEFTAEEFQTAEYLVRLTTEKWISKLLETTDEQRRSPYQKAHVDRDMLFGLLQAGPLPAIETEIKKLAPQQCDFVRVGLYLRSTCWEKLRGLKWRDLPYTFTRGRLRKKPPQSDFAADITAIAKAKGMR